MTIFASIRSIALVVGLVVAVDGVPVERTSITGFTVAGQKGLSADEATKAVERATLVAAVDAEVEALDTGWTMPVALPVPVVASVAVKVASVKVAPFYSRVQDAVKPHHKLGTLRLRRSWAKGSFCVIVSCFAGSGPLAGEHGDLALLLAGSLCNGGFEAKTVGSDVMVFAST